MTAAGECSECTHFFLNLALHQTEGHARIAVLVQRERTRECRPCRRGLHDRCVGIACHCTTTPRCEANAAITADRETA